ncbi:MAG TPA: hypothetical protein EYG73_09335 [Arcobacter sp.]|nr:hypothetical protein [Arcobacter sp.]
MKYKLVEVKSKKHNFGLEKIIIGFLSIALIFIVPIYGLPYLTYLFIYYYLKKNKFNFSIIIALIFLVLFFTTSIDRRDWLFLMLSIVFMIYSQINNKKILSVILTGIIGLIILSYLLVAFRTDGLFNYKEVYGRLTETKLPIAIFEMEGDFPIVTDDVIIIFDSLLTTDKVEYLYGSTFFKPFYSFIPREIWADKPESISRVFSRIFNNYKYLGGGSEPLTIYGELFWNFSYLSIVFFGIFSFIIAYIDSTIKEAIKNKNADKLALFIVYVALSFHLLRGPIDNFWIAFFVLYILIIIEKNLQTILYNISRTNK